MTQKHNVFQILSQSQEREMYKSASGELIGTVHGIVDGLEEAVVEPKIAGWYFYKAYAHHGKKLFFFKLFN